MTNTETLPRSSNDWISAADLRALIKQTLGYNQRQVTVRGESSQYLKIIVRDAAVDVAAVEQLAKGLHTWSMAIDDYVTGQSVHVSTTAEVDAAHAAPFVAVIRETIARILAGGSNQIEAGFFLMHHDRDAYIWDSEANRHSVRVWAPSIASLDERSIQHLALRFGQMKKGGAK
jgi:hypothetical protein